MSDSDSDVVQTIKVPTEISAKKPRKKSEAQRLASTTNIAKARAARSAKKIERLKGEDEQKVLLAELIAEKKASKAQPAPPSTKIEKRPDKVQEESEESEASEGESESEVSEESDSSDSEAEFVLTKRAPAKKQVKKALKKGEKVKRSTLLEQVEILTSALKRERKLKKQTAPVNVNITYPEKKTTSDAAKRVLLDL